MPEMKKLDEVRLILTQIRELQKQIREADKPLPTDTTEKDGRKWQYWRGQTAEGRQQQERQREALRTAGRAYDLLFSSLSSEIATDPDLTNEEKRILTAYYLQGKGFADSARDAGINRQAAVLFLKDYRKAQGNVRQEKCQDKRPPEQLDIFQLFA